MACAFRRNAGEDPLTGPSRQRHAVHRAGWAVVLLILLAPGSELLAEGRDWRAEIHNLVAAGKLEEARWVTGELFLSDPADAELRFLHAQVLGWSGRYAESLLLLQELRREQPANLEYTAATMNALLWSGQARRAAKLVDPAGDPGLPEELWTLKTRALLAVGERDAWLAARDLLDQARLAFPNAKWVDELRAELERSDERNTVLRVGYIYESLGDERGTSTNRHVAATFGLGGGRSLTGTLGQTRRFGASDLSVGVGGSMPLGPNWTASGSVSFGPDNIVNPRQTIRTELLGRLSQRWVVGLGAASSEYRDIQVNMANLSFQAYLDRYLFSYRLSGSRAAGIGSGHAHEVRAYRYYRDDSMVALAASEGVENESLGIDGIVRSEFNFWSILGLHRLHPEWAVFWRLSYYRSRHLYDSKGVGVEFHYQF